MTWGRLRRSKPTVFEVPDDEPDNGTGGIVPNGTPRTWNGPLLVDGAQARQDMIESKLLTGMYL